MGNDADLHKLKEYCKESQDQSTEIAKSMETAIISYNKICSDLLGKIMNYLDT